MTEAAYNAFKEVIAKQHQVVSALTSLIQSETNLLSALHLADAPKPTQPDASAPQIPAPPRYEGVAASGPGWFYVPPTNIGSEPEPPKPAPVPAKTPIEQIAEFCAENDLNHVEPERFFKYYNDRKWRDKSGKKITDWKALVRHWNNQGKKRVEGAILTSEKSLKEPDKIFDQIHEEYKNL